MKNVGALLGQYFEHNITYTINTSLFLSLWPGAQSPVCLVTMAMGYLSDLVSFWFVVPPYFLVGEKGFYF